MKIKHEGGEGMNEPMWYVVGTDGIAELHRDRAHAEATVARRDCGGEFKAMQLVDAAELEALRSVSTEMAREGMAIMMKLDAANSRIAELESQLKVARDFMLND